MIDTSQFSVIVCNYNLGPQLKNTAEEFRQLFPEIELILCDDNSEDDSVNWATKSGLFDGIYVKGEKEGNSINTLRNIGCSIAKREYLVLVDSSNKPTVGLLFSHYTVLKTFPKSVSAGIIDRIEESGNIHLDEKYRLFAENQTVVPLEWYGLTGGNMGFRKSSWLDIGMFAENFSGSGMCEDAEFGFRARRKGYSIYCHKACVVMHQYHYPFIANLSKNSKKLDEMYRINKVEELYNLYSKGTDNESKDG